MGVVLNCWEKNNSGVDRVASIVVDKPGAGSASGEDPQDPAVGDTLVIFTWNDDGGNAAQWDDVTYKPTGFDFITQVGDNVVDVHVGLFQRIVDGTEGSSFSVPSVNTNVHQGAACILIKGAHTVTPIPTIGTGGVGDAPLAIPGITTVNDLARVLIAAVFDGGDATGIGWSTGFTALDTVIGNAGDAFGFSGMLAYKDMPAKGATGNATVSASPTDGMAGFMVEIAPAPAAPGAGDEDVSAYQELWFDVSAPVTGQGATECFAEVLTDPGLVSTIGPTSLGLPTEDFVYWLPESDQTSLPPGDYVMRFYYVDADTVAPGNYTDTPFTILDTPILATPSAPTEDVANTDSTTAAFTAPAATNKSGTGSVEIVPYFLGANLAPDPSFAGSKTDALTGNRERDGFDLWAFAGGIATYSPDGVNQSWLFTSCCSKGAGTAGTVKFPFTCTQGYLVVQNGFTDPIIGGVFGTADSGTTVECSMFDMTSQYLVFLPSKTFTGTIGTYEYIEGVAQTQQASLDFEKTVAAGTTVRASYVAVHATSGVKSKMSKMASVTATPAAPPAIVAIDDGPITIIQGSVDNVIDVLANDLFDTITDPAVVLDVTQPTEGSVVIDPDNAAFVLYTPNPAYTGPFPLSDPFTYKPGDSAGTPVEGGYATVNVVVIEGAEITLTGAPVDPYILADHAYEVDLVATHSMDGAVNWTVATTDGSASITPGGVGHPADKTAKLLIDTTGASGDFTVTVTVGDADVSEQVEIDVKLAPPYGPKPSVVTL